MIWVTPATVTSCGVASRGLGRNPEVWAAAGWVWGCGFPAALIGAPQGYRRPAARARGDDPEAMPSRERSEDPRAELELPTRAFQVGKPHPSRAGERPHVPAVYGPPDAVRLVIGDGAIAEVDRIAAEVNERTEKSGRAASTPSSGAHSIRCGLDCWHRPRPCFACNTPPTAGSFAA